MDEQRRGHRTHEQRDGRDATLLHAGPFWSGAAGV